MGKCLYNVLAIYNHHPYENLSHLGKSSRGTEVYINNMYLQSDIRIGIGTIMPHVMAGFGGGAKIVAIGVAGMETISQNHDGKGLGGQGGPVGNVDHNPMRADLEEIARMAELDAIVNVVANRRRQIGGVFVGELVEAHRRGVAMHRKVWSTRCPRLMDVAVFNVYPKDVNPGVINALSPSWIEGEPVVRRGGVVVFTTASPEGPDIHSRESFGMRGHEDLCDLVNTIELFKERQVIVYSPNLARRHIRHQLPEGSLVCQRWSEVINSIKRTVAGRPRVAVFPTASFQLGY
jgi:nickel-dependent lactate racemase